MKKRNHTLEYYHKIREIDEMMEHFNTEKMDEHDTSNSITNRVVIAVGMLDYFTFSVLPRLPLIC